MRRDHKVLKEPLGRLVNKDLSVRRGRKEKVVPKVHPAPKVQLDHKAQPDLKVRME